MQHYINCKKHFSIYYLCTGSCNADEIRLMVMSVSCTAWKYKSVLQFCNYKSLFCQYLNEITLSVSYVNFCIFCIVAKHDIVTFMFNYERDDALYCYSHAVK